MKKNILSLILLVLVFSSVFATKHNHTDENEVRYVKNNVELNPQYQQQLRNTEIWRSFMIQNPETEEGMRYFRLKEYNYIIE